jgi:hypothetical protein
MSHFLQRIPWDAVALCGLAGTSIGTLVAAAVGSEIKDAEPCDHISPFGCQEFLTVDAVTDFNNTGFCEIKNVLNPVELTQARLSARAIFDEGRMEVSSNDKTVRQDRICWLRENDGTPLASGALAAVQQISPAMLYCIGFLRGIAGQLQRQKYTRSSNHFVPKQLQLARYSGEGNQTYSAHRDAASKTDFWKVGLLGWLACCCILAPLYPLLIFRRLQGNDYRRRCVTAILYLNDDNWNVETDGGALKCYMNSAPEDNTGETATVIKSVAPIGGTLVLFDSRYLLHEVCPSNRERYALTLWIVGDDAEVSNSDALTKIR